MPTIFTKIISNEIPSVKIYEDNDTIAILDINPNNKGHALIMPKKEYESIIDCPEDVLSKLVAVAKKISIKMLEVLKCDGINIVMNNKPAAGQVVPHIHLHVIPRFSSDGMTLVMPKKKYYEGEIEAYGKKLRI